MSHVVAFTAVVAPKRYSQPPSVSTRTLQRQLVDRIQVLALTDPIKLQVLADVVALLVPASPARCAHDDW